MYFSKDYIDFLLKKHCSEEKKKKYKPYLMLFANIELCKKYKVLHRYIFHSLLLSIEEKTELYVLFSYIQKYGFAISKLQNILRWKKHKFYDYNYDMQLNELNDLKEENKIVIYHEGRKYRFSLFDLHKIFNKSLLNCNDYVASPQHPKNPFNNKKFKTIDIINIFHKMMDSKIFIKPHVLDYYYCGLNLDKYKNKHFYLLREMLVNEVMESDNIEMLYDYLRDICFDFFSCFPYRLPVNTTSFFKKKCVNRTRHIIRHYLMMLYFPEDCSIYTQHQNFLIRKCKLFNLDNPVFGRDIVHVRRSHSNSSNNSVTSELSMQLHFLNGNPFTDVSNSTSVVPPNIRVDNASELISPQNNYNRHLMFSPSGSDLSSPSTFDTTSPYARSFYNYQFHYHTLSQDHNYQLSPENYVLDASNLLLGAGQGLGVLLNNPNDLEISFITQATTLHSLTDSEDDAIDFSLNEYLAGIRNSINIEPNFYELDSGNATQNTQQNITHDNDNHNYSDIETNSDMDSVSSEEL